MYVQAPCAGVVLFDAMCALVMATLPNQQEAEHCVMCRDNILAQALLCLVADVHHKANWLAFRISHSFELCVFAV